MAFRHHNDSIELELIDSDHPRWAEVTSQVQCRYKQAFDAELHSFMPAFLALLKDKRITSLCGFRIAQNEPLFLEQYLDQSAEKLLSDIFDKNISRQGLIEFGQLASFAHGFSPLHFTLIAEKLVEFGFEWCIFTATDPLYALMKHMGLNPQIIAEANPNRISSAATIWGNYYQYQPRIMAGNLQQGLNQLNSLNLVKKYA